MLGSYAAHDHRKKVDKEKKLVSISRACRQERLLRDAWLLIRSPKRLRHRGRNKLCHVFSLLERR